VTDDFIWVGQHPGLDLCNTEPVIDGALVDLLTGPEALVAWAAGAGIPAPPESALSDRTVRWSRALRDGLRAALDPPERDPDRLGHVDGLLRPVRGTLGLATTPDPRLVLRSGDPDAQFRLDLAAATVPALGLDPTRVRRCANPACVLLYHDVSKAGRRRWCDMAVCGNRAKAAAHLARARSAPSE
jgi:predicted RNA-binding Zn ribbon-like protein